MTVREALAAEMGAAGVMCWSSLWPLALVVFSPLMCQATQPQMEVMSAPNLLRAGVAENIFLEIQDCPHQHDIVVNVTVMNHPAKIQLLASTLVTLRAKDNYQNFGELMVPARHFNRDPNQKNYVYLQAQFPGLLLERIVLVSFQFGYIFIQTDKTIYTPESSVLYRVFGVTPAMKPVERGGPGSSDASVNIEIVNPDEITVESNLISLQSGIYAYSFLLGKVVSPGQWKVVAKFQSNPEQSFVAPFEVKEYVLPTFEVKLKPSRPFFYVDDTELDVTIEAKYLFGEEVDGSAWVVFGYLEDGKKFPFPTSIQRQSVVAGTATATLRGEHIQNIKQLVKKHIYVSVSVLTHSGDEMVEAEKRGIQIVTSPYTIHFRRTPTFFKPGFYFDVTIEVLNPDETPAPNIEVVLEGGSQGSRTSITEANGITRMTINTDKSFKPLEIVAKTNAPRLSSQRQATATMRFLPHKATNNHYMHIGLENTDVAVNENMKLTFNYNNQRNEAQQITYLILSRGQMVSYGSKKTTGQVNIADTLRVTKEMMPSFRIIAYYHTSDNQVVSDSLWVNVKESCMGSLKLEDSKPGNSYQPRYNFNMKVTGDPGARVELVAVDKGVYVLNNKHRLTQKKIWEVVEKFDTGCTPGGGADNMGVFFDAGLLFVSRSSVTAYRQELQCPTPPSRKKRASTIMEVRSSLLNNYEGLPRECCLDGISDIPLSYSCERRSEYISESQECTDAFMHCCKEMEKQLTERREDELLMARSDTTDEIDSIEVQSRSKFPESWFWGHVNLPSCDRSDPDCQTTFATKFVPLPDSITTWQFTGISLSRTHGICVADSFEIRVQKEFFIDLKLPYSAVRGEQLEIKAVLHNYSPIDAEVRVELKEHGDLCSLASKRGKYRQEVRVKSQATRAVFFIMIPMKDGHFEVVVKAIATNAYQLNDQVTKTLRVVSDGVLTKAQRIISLHPPEGRRQEISFNSEIPLQDMVPNTYKSTLISVTGREQLGNLLESAVSGKSMETMIRAPYGCGEQNAASMTLPLIAATYLDKTNQWEAAGLEKRDEALRYIRQGYQSELKYRRSDGSFSVFVGNEGSSWLTAYVAKLFSIASNLVQIERSVICDAIRFLILKAQQPDGMFVETGYVYSNAMRGGVLTTNSDVSMTAFCVIAMQESRTLCDGTIDVTGSINKAVGYIEGRLPHLTYPYAVAIASYALANENKMNLATLDRFATDSSHWLVPNSNEYTLEGTAYALLALVKAREFEKARPVVRWFAQQNRVDSYYGSYGSTQATIMVYQAMAEYWANAEEPEYDLNVDMTLPGKSKPLKWKFNKGSQFSTRTSDFNNINQNVTIVAEGVGEAIVTLVSMYYAMPAERESNCQKFNLSVHSTPVKLDEDEKIYKLTIEVMFKDRNQPSTMAILDVGLPTGFSASTKDLDKLSTGHARTIQKYERDNELSEKSNIIIYLKKVSNTRPEEISFHIHQRMKVGLLQPAAVSVYEYTAKDISCVQFYNPQRKSGQLLRLCRGDLCTCAEDNCSMQKKKNIENNKRTQKICESTQTSKIDFAYKIRVQDMLESSSTDIYTVRIEEVIKEGNTDVAPQGKLRSFLAFQFCRESVGLLKGKTYLVMGSSADISGSQFDNSNKFRYVLGENTWVEYWPTAAECQGQEFRSTCNGITEMVDVFQVFGCQQK